MQPQTPFEFLIPIEKGIQHDPKTGDIFVDGPISTESHDLQNQQTLYSSVLKGLDTFNRLGRPVDYNHWSVKPPEGHDFKRDGAPVQFIIGEGEELHDGPAPDGRTTKYLRTRLFKGKQATRDCLKHLDEGGKLYYSIGGKASVKGDTIIDTRISHVAITPYPANPDCEIGIVGIQALAKSLCPGPNCPDPDGGCSLPTTAPSGATLEIRADMGALEGAIGVIQRTLASLQGLGKTLTAGSGPGMGSEGGRALGVEDLEGAPKNKGCKCGSAEGKCRCDDPDDSGDPQADTGADSSASDHSHSIINITSRLSGRHGREKKMAKKLDAATVAELEEMEKDPKMGVFAKAFGWLSDRLAKGGDDDADDDKDGGDEDPDGDSDGDGEDCDKPGMMGKGFDAGEGYSFFGDQNVEAIEMDAAAFQKNFMAGVEAMIDRKFKDLKKSLAADSDKKFAELKKSLDEANGPTNDLLKTLEQIGMRPRATGGTASGAGAVDQGAAKRNRNDVRNLLMKGIHQGRVTPDIMTAFEVHGTVEESLLKSLEA